MKTKSAMITIAGRPNVGKSTLTNALVGEKIAIVSNKPQTTRNRICAVVNRENTQLVFIDTPGFHRPRTKLGDYMVNVVKESVADVDAVILLVEPIANVGEQEHALIERIKASGAPAMLVINKIDLTTQETLDALVERWRKVLPDAEIVPVSALNNFNIGGLFDRILAALPEGEPYYPKDTLTDKTLRFFASEIIREKILLNYQKEIPYCTEVVIDEYKEDADMDRIAATIYVARESQKGIVIGHQGGKLKKVGTEAREELEQFLDKKVFLKLYVKVNDNWRNDERQLRRFGYIES